MEERTTTVRMPEELAEKADVITRGRGISVNALMLQALEAEIERVRHDDDFMARLRRVGRTDRKEPSPARREQAAGVAVTHHVCILDGHTLQVPTNDVVQLMLAVAAGDFSETDVAAWLTDRLQPLDSR